MTTYMVYLESDNLLPDNNYDDHKSADFFTLYCVGPFVSQNVNNLANVCQ